MCIDIDLKTAQLCPTYIYILRIVSDQVVLSLMNIELNQNGSVCDRYVCCLSMRPLSGPNDKRPLTRLIIVTVDI